MADKQVINMDHVWDEALRAKERGQTLAGFECDEISLTPRGLELGPIYNLKFEDDQQQNNL